MPLRGEDQVPLRGEGQVPLRGEGQVPLKEVVCTWMKPEQCSKQ